jgi:SAM-dependent methyltransferase
MERFVEVSNMGFVRRLIASQVAICSAIDKKVFGGFSVDGNKSFVGLADRLVPDGSRIADVGGGKTPFFSADEVRKRGFVVTGVDMDADELAHAPAGCYQHTTVGPIEECHANHDHDVVIAQSVLEHVRDGSKAAQGIGTLLREGGVVATFCPCRRAWFARLNLLLPESFKRYILFAIFPAKRERQGFPAFYSGCTPGEMERNMAAAGIEMREMRYYFVSSYFKFFVPFYLFWRLATYPLMRLWPHRYCETFMFVGVRTAAGVKGES